MLSSPGWRAFSVVALSVWISSADHLRDLALELHSFSLHLLMTRTLLGDAYRTR